MANDVLFEVDTPIPRDIFVNHSPGIWKAFLTPGSSAQQDEVWNLYIYGNQNDVRTRIESVRVDGAVFSQADTLGDLTTDSSFYWDNNNQIIYITFNNFNPPGTTSSIILGSAIGFSQGNNKDIGNVYNGVSFQTRLTSVPNLRKNADPLFFGILEYGGGAVSLKNDDGDLDNFPDLGLFGQECRIYEVVDDAPIQRYEGVIGDVSNDLTSIRIAVKDKRIGLSRKIPVDKYTAAFDSRNVGKTVPICYGSVLNVPTTQLTTTTYRAVDNINSPVIDAVYAEGISISFTDVGDGSFAITAGQKQITADVTSNVTNGLEIIEDILDRYLSIAFNSSNYNTTEWASSKAVVRDSGIYIKDKKVNDIIEQICQDNAGVFEVEDDGRYTFRKFDTSKAAVKDILIDENLDYVNIDYPVDEYLTSVIIGYSKDEKENDFIEYENLDFEEEVFSKFLEYRTKGYDTTLGTLADAEDLSNEIMERSKDIVSTVTVTVPDKIPFGSVQNNDLKILDVINLQVDRPQKEIQGVRRYEVLGINRNLTSRQVTLTCREIKE